MSRLPKGFWKELKCKPCTEYEDGDIIVDGKDELVQGIFCQDCGPVECSSFFWNTNRKASIRRLCPRCFQLRKDADDERRHGLVNHAANEK